MRSFNCSSMQSAEARSLPPWPWPLRALGPWPLRASAGTCCRQPLNLHCLDGYSSRGNSGRFLRRGARSECLVSQWQIELRSSLRQRRSKSTVDDPDHQSPTTLEWPRQARHATLSPIPSPPLIATQSYLQGKVNHLSIKMSLKEQPCTLRLCPPPRPHHLGEVELARKAR